MLTHFNIAQRFCGPPGIGNGGYVAGRLAGALPGAVEVTLRRPTPLDTELSRRGAHGSATLHAPDGTLLAEARVGPALELVPLPAVSFAEAGQASKRFLGFRHHPYPDCFVCGLTRPANELAGLALHPGALDDLASAPRPCVAAPFVPPADLCDAAGLLATEQVWAALDCPSWFGHAAFVESTPPMLLGKLAVELLRRPAAGEPCVVLGFALGQEGRRILCGSALLAAGQVIAHARATWITLKTA